MTARTCEVKGCSKAHYGRGYCRYHYDRWRRMGDPEYVREPAPKKICAVDDCDQKSVAKHLCGKHYKRWRTHGTTSRVPQKPRTKVKWVCSIEGCDGLHEARGWCGKHYARWRLYGDPEHPYRERVVRTCQHPGGCLRMATGEGWCKMHLRRIRENGDPGPAKPYAVRLPKIPACIHEDEHGIACGKPTVGHGLCSTHNRARQRRLKRAKEREEQSATRAQETA